MTIYAAAHVASGNPPQANVKYLIEFSTDEGKSYKSMVRDWIVPRRGDEPSDFWSQSFCYGSKALPDSSGNPVRIRFRNTAGKKYLRAEAHAVYGTQSQDSTRVTFDWRDSAGPHRESHVFPPDTTTLTGWDIKTGKSVQTRWVEFEPVIQ